MIISHCPLRHGPGTACLFLHKRHLKAAVGCEERKETESKEQTAFWLFQTLHTAVEQPSAEAMIPLCKVELLCTRALIIILLLWVAPLVNKMSFRASRRDPRRAVSPRRPGFRVPHSRMRPAVRVAVLLSEERQRPIKDAKVHRRLRLHVEVDWSA
jgi:hypothetical protein